jgi:CRISPR system Cascade subunit CasA
VKARFNLIDEKWIPCLMQDGTRGEYGIGEALVKAHEIRGICGPSPLVTTALHRLLIAVLHRALDGPKNTEEWATLWADGKGRWNAARISGYLDRVRDRFFFLGGEKPFFQARGEAPAGLDWWDPRRLAREMPDESSATLFEHTTYGDPFAMSAAVAARLLVAYHAFALGGLVTYEKGLSKAQVSVRKSARSGPLVNCAVALVRGANLFQTLALNLHCLNYDDGEPFDAEAVEDAPAWERGDALTWQARMPAGYLDYLTWTSRRIWLRCEESGAGPQVTGAAILKGPYPPWSSRKGKETMVAFRRDARARGKADPWPPIGFDEQRALWRESQALFSSLDTDATGYARPKTLDWLADLAHAGVDLVSACYNVDVLGLCSGQKKPEFWRHERLPLPLTYLDDEFLVARLREALTLAETVGSEISGAGWRLARLMLFPAKAETEPLSKEQKGGVKKLLAHLAPGRPYWARLEVPFKRLLVALPDDKTEADGTLEYGRRSLLQWARVVRKTGLEAFRGTVRGLDRTARALKAIAIAETRLQRRVAGIVKPYLDGGEEVADEQAD